MLLAADFLFFLQINLNSNNILFRDSYFHVVFYEAEMKVKTGTVQPPVDQFSFS